MNLAKKATGKLRWRKTDQEKVLEQEVVIYEEMGNTQLYIETAWLPIEEVEAPNGPEGSSQSAGNEPSQSG